MLRCATSLARCLLLAALCLAAKPADAKPNLVLLFADDAGYGDFGFHGSRNFETPHLDRLADSGVVLSQFYVSASVCGPSRAGMLTGRYQQRFGFLENNVPGAMSASSKLIGDQMGLPTHLPTMGDHLRSLGYRTAVFGKWHLGIADRYHPTRRGFDEFYGFRGGARSYYPLDGPEQGQHENRIERGFGEYGEHEGYLTNALADEACDFIERHSEQPFFAYVAFNAVHGPMQADPQDADEFAQLQGARRTAAQMTLSLDRACGQIVAKLEELGLRENTLIVFTNDNGGPSDRNGSSNYPLSGVKGTHLEGGVRVPCIVSWPGTLPRGEKNDLPMSSLDLLPTLYAAGGGDVSALKEIDGADLTPYLCGETPGRPHETLYWKKGTRAAIRDGDWKLIRFLDRPAQLYNLADDPGEQNDLAMAERVRTQELFAKLFAWETRLERPLFQLKPSTEKWSSQRLDTFGTPPSADD